VHRNLLSRLIKEVAEELDIPFFIVEAFVPVMCYLDENNAGPNSFSKQLSTMVNIWCNMPNMKAALLKHDKFTDEYGNLVEMKIWKTTANDYTPYGVKYSLVYVVNGQRVVGYDNERGKGDHRHLGADETSYHFIDIDLLVEDFLKDVEGFIRRNHEG